MNFSLLINASYIVASILFILGLKMLSSPVTARRGNMLSALGMLIAVVVTLLDKNILTYRYIIIGLASGSLIGVAAARLVAMTGMPQMVALFNGFGGIASLLVAWSIFASKGIHSSFTLVTLFLSVMIGGLTFTGSMVAYGKLSGRIPGRPLAFPGQSAFAVMLLAALLASGVFIVIPSMIPVNFSSEHAVVLAVVLTALLGILLVLPIGGADMPVVISLLNSYSGLAACMAGFAVKNNVLIVSGALVGASGIILTNIMCKAMNRSLLNVLFGGFGSTKKGAGSEKSKGGEVNPISAEDAFMILEAARSVVIVPGYGMAVARAQHVVKELADLLEANGTEVSFAIHPVAGRMPGHMNVLLAEAEVPYEQLREMDEINPLMETMDAALVIGANDVVNPAAHEQEGSPIYGMPVINADKARTVFVLKRSMNPGFAGIENPLFYKENTRMLFGDAKESIQTLVGEFREL